MTAELVRTQALRVQRRPVQSMRMSNREFFLKIFKSERPKFLSVLRALPEGKLDYKPHERSSSAKMIAWFLVLELRALVQMVKTRENHWQQSDAPATGADIASEYDKAASEMEQALVAATDGNWEENTRMYYNGKLMKTSPLGDTVWDFFHDAIHHRGQLTTYIRPMGGKVPSIYGPSGDSK